MEQNDSGIRISQRAMIADILKETELEECFAVNTPLEPSLELVCEKKTHDNCKLVSDKMYRSIIGKLLYLAGSTRPDISFAVSSLSRFNEQPHQIHWMAAKRVIRYLKGTIDLGIQYSRSENRLFGHSDADWANCKVDRKSYTGYVVIFGGGPVAWESRKQPTVALSTTEAEYMAITSASRELLFCKEILMAVGFGRLSGDGIILSSDNLGAIKMATRVGFSSRAKHIDVKHHFIRELVMSDKIVLKHVRSWDMLADVLTKALGGTKHMMNIRRLMN